MIKLKLAFQLLCYLAAEPWGDADILFFKNRKLSSSFSLSWKLALIKEGPVRVLLTWLLQGEQTLHDWYSVCETAKLRSLKSSANFRFVTPWRRTLKNKRKRFSVALRKGYNWPVLLTYRSCADLFRLRTPFSRHFWRRSSLRRV